MITRSRSALMMIALLSVPWAQAQTPPAAHPEMSREVREKMAALHEQMASCLRSDKSVAQCHDELMKSCEEQLGTTGCPMMGMGHWTDPRHRMQPMSTTPR